MCKNSSGIRIAQRVQVTAMRICFIPTRIAIKRKRKMKKKSKHYSLKKGITFHQEKRTDKIAAECSIQILNLISHLDRR